MRSRSMRLTDVAVTVAPDADNLLGQRRARVRDRTQRVGSRSPPNSPSSRRARSTIPSARTRLSSNALAATPEGKAFVRAKAASRVKEALDTGLKPALPSGTRPVKLEVTVHAFTVPSAIQRVLVGGQPVLNASAVLKDATTGEVLVSRPNTMAMAMSGNGWGGGPRRSGVVGFGRAPRGILRGAIPQVAVARGLSRPLRLLCLRCT